MTKKYKPRKFQSTRRTGLLFVTKETYETAVAKMPEAKRPDALNAALVVEPVAEVEAVDLFDVLEVAGE